MLSKHFKKAAEVPCEPPLPPHPYLSLQGDEIRLLTINPGSPNLESTSQISCSLQHVDLPGSQDNGVGGGVADSGRHRGYARDWPELQTAPDKGRLLKTDSWVQKQVLSKYDEKSQQSLDPDVGGCTLAHEEGLPWRHSWGDYVALSYVWGPQTPAKTILIDGLPFLVGPNLYLALEQLRRSQRIQQGFKVWIDAICINQQDIDERGQQVGRMRDIYASAWQVVSWLGGGQDDSDMAIDALRYMARLPTEPGEIEGLYRVKRGMDVRPLFITWDSYESPFRKEVFKAILGFLTRPYWRRMWILQEVAMAHPEAPVLCGGKCLSWAEIRDAAALITADEERFGRLVTGTLPSTWNFEIGQARLSERRHLSPERLWRLMTELLQVQNDQNDASFPGVTTDMLRPLLLARDAAVTQEKDRVYGILGIKAVAERVSLVPDYTLPLAVNFQRFSSALLLGGNLDLFRLVSLLDKPIYTKGSLAGLGSRVLEAAPCVHNLPSWVICWTCAALPAAHLRAAYRAGGKPTVESQSAVVISDSCLRMQGLIVDTIVSLGTCHPAEATDDYPASGSKCSNNPYGGLDETREALWRTMVGNSTAQGECPAPEEYAWLLDPRIWRDAVAGVFAHGLGLESVMKRYGSLDLCGYSLKELIFGSGRTRRPWGERYYNPTKTQREALAWAVDVLAWRRLMSTESGRLGLAPTGAVVGTGSSFFRVAMCR
ncbi:heterokaryon incompatibility protein [Apiospora hydei]|uniref:Heterokaryon incompatibility protein n=1 Tax=Apiospora hydei TaxID=1337664 RepID=A0ABR1WA72_9PEZI